jgi:uncharacterized damage-inducible protein DinB
MQKHPAEGALQHAPFSKGISDGLLEYIGKVHQRTTRVAQCIPPDKLEWSYRDGKFTLGDLLRHIAAVERYMFAETAQGQLSCYAGCGRELADGYDAVMTFRETLHAQTLEILSRLGDEGLQGKCITPDAAKITVWKWFRLMTEHEIHHRGQIYLYLGPLGGPDPAALRAYIRGTPAAQRQNLVA